MAPASRAFLLTYNPDEQPVDDEEWAGWIEATAARHRPETRWSTGVRKSGISDGDRAFLLRQGPEPRGIIASGHFMGEVYSEGHWLYQDERANYADVEWDVVIDQDEPLPLATMQAALPDQHWRPQSSGTEIHSTVLIGLERLWAEHTSQPLGPAGAPPRGRSRQQGWLRDPVLRKKVEDAAQTRLMEHYDSLDWEVEDKRFEEPFDAKATKDGRVLYLEAKGTVRAGDSVIVTRNEVRWAREHPGRCVLGVLSDIRFTAGGEVDPNSGTFRLFKWLPDDDELDPRHYDWSPNPDKQIGT